MRSIGYYVVVGVSSGLWFLITSTALTNREIFFRENKYARWVYLNLGITCLSSGFFTLQLQILDIHPRQYPLFLTILSSVIGFNTIMIGMYFLWLFVRNLRQRRSTSD
jgi:hypothetical protein